MEATALVGGTLHYAASDKQVLRPTCHSKPILNSCHIMQSSEANIKQRSYYEDIGRFPMQRSWNYGIYSLPVVVSRCRCQIW